MFSRKSPCGITFGSEPETCEVTIRVSFRRCKNITLSSESKQRAHLWNPCDLMQRTLDFGKDQKV